MLFANTPPRAGPHAIRTRNQQESVNVLKPLFGDYQALGKELLKLRVGLDLYIFGKENMVFHELATVHYLSSSTGGSVNLYIPYNHEKYTCFYLQS